MNDFSFLDQKKNGGPPAIMQPGEPVGPSVGKAALEAARNQLAAYDPQIDALVEQMAGFVIKSDADLATVAEMIGQAKALNKSLTLAAEVAYKPAYDHYKAIRNILTMYANKLSQMVSAGNKKSSEWGYSQEMERRKRQAEADAAHKAQQKKLDALAKKNKVAPMKIPAAVVPEKVGPVKTESGSVNIKMVWKAHIDDIRSPAVFNYVLATCLDDYKKLADKAMAKAVKAGIRKMKGASFNEVAEAKHRAR